MDLMEGENPLSKTLGKAALRAMHVKDNQGFITMQHKISTFLNPAFRRLENVSHDFAEREEVVLKNLTPN